MNCEAGSLGESRRAVNAGEVLAIALLAKMLGGIEGGILAVCMGDVCMRVVTIEIEEIVWTRWWCGDGVDEMQECAFDSSVSSRG